MHTHMYTCIEIANGHPHGGIHVYMFTTCMCVCICVCMCVHMHACMGHPHTPIPTLTPIHPPTPPPGPQNQSKFNNTLTNQDDLIPFKDLKSVETLPLMSGCMVWWMDGWVDGCGQVKSLKLLKI